MRIVNYLLAFSIIIVVLVYYLFTDELSVVLGEDYDSGTLLINSFASNNENENRDVRGVLNFVVDNPELITDEITIYVSSKSFVDAYQNGRGDTLANGSELINGNYFVVLKIKTIAENVHYILKEVKIENGEDVDIKCSLNDALKFKNIESVAVTKRPVRSTYIIGEKFYLDGTEIMLVYDNFYFTIGIDNFENYDIEPYLKKDDEIVEIAFGDLIEDTYEDYVLYLGTRNKGANVKIFDMLVDDDIDYNGVYGEFFNDNTYADSMIKSEALGCFNYFYDNYNRDSDSYAYGFVPTHVNIDGEVDIADPKSAGYAMIASMIGVENGWISEIEGYQFMSTVLTTMSNLDNYKGMFYETYDYNTGLPKSDNVNVTDTATFIACTLVAGNYFGGHIEEIANSLYERCEWDLFFSSEKNKYFYNKYNAEEGFDDIIKEYEGQLLVYIFAAAKTGNQDVIDAYYDVIDSYIYNNEELDFIYTWNGTLNQHLEPMMFLDGRGYMDKYGVDWYKNTLYAIESDISFITEREFDFKTYKLGFGLGASDTETGYIENHGSSPSGFSNDSHVYDGTLSPYTALASLPYKTSESFNALRNYRNYPYSVGDYGLYSAINVDDDWVSLKYNSVEKGMILCSFANYYTDVLYELFTANEIVTKGLNELEFKIYRYNNDTDEMHFKSIQSQLDNYDRLLESYSTYTLEERYSRTMYFDLEKIGVEDESVLTREELEDYVVFKNIYKSYISERDETKESIEQEVERNDIEINAFE
ncbi:MAG: glucoamylase family protein [Lachnospirales bacterium]